MFALLRLPLSGCVRGSGRRSQFPRLRLAVSFAGGHEQFAWPGGAEFGERNIFELLGSGAMVTGDFASFARRGFSTDRPEYGYAGESAVEGRKAHRYTYTVGAERSTPRTTAAEIQSRAGVVSRKRTEFRDCRHCVGELTIRFGEEHGSTPAPVQVKAFAPAAAQLPAGVRLNTHLASPLRIGECAVGDPVTFVVSREIRTGAFQAPKGALRSGRIVTMAEHLRPEAFAMLSLRTMALEVNGTHADFHGEVKEIVRFSWTALPREAR
jgi:hypothetical protein